MAKAGMKHNSGEEQPKKEDDGSGKHGRNEIPLVPEIQGKAKHGNEKAGRIN